MDLRPRLALAILALSGVPGAWAQTYPASLVTQLTGPRTLFLDEYADPIRPKIRTTIYFTDFTEVSWQFSLRLRITGPHGIVLTTKPGHRPAQPLIVAPAQPYLIEGADLAFYFDYSHLDFSGISRSQLEVSNRLPEGSYTFCFEAVDFETGKVVSHPGCASAYLSLNDPPIITAPVFGSVVENISLQNILFQWQQGNANGNLSLSALSYQLQLYEVNNSWANPVTAILNNQALPIWQSDPVQQFSLLYSNIHPPLEKGKRYVFTVRAIESSGRSSFKNNGYSTPSYFHYGYTENDTIEIVKPADNFQFTLGTPSEFKWKRPRKALPSQMIAYTLKLVELGNGQDPGNAILYNLPFFQQTYLANTSQVMEKTIPVTIWANIKRMGRYAWQVTAQSGTQLVAKSVVNTFTGPPEIETFIAGGFLMKVTSLTQYDKSNNKISGSCKTTLSASWNGEETSFKFSNIYITPIGNNEWVMVSGAISDKIGTPSYTLQPKTFADNGAAFFDPDSIEVTTSGVKLAGRLEWNFPHPGSNGQRERILSRRCRLTLANTSFFLSNSQPVKLYRNYDVSLLEPYGFRLMLNQSSEFFVYQSKYECSFSGFAGLPAGVVNDRNEPVLLAIKHAAQLHYMTPDENQDSEAILLAKNTGFSLLPLKYTIDLYERTSPAEFGQDSAWKGVYIERARLHLPKSAESTGQISLSTAGNFSFSNIAGDTVQAHVGGQGLFLNAAFPFVMADSVKFNGFASKHAIFHAKILAGEIKRAGLLGAIHIPLLDTAGVFPYRIDLTASGFGEGYLLNALANQTFTFNAGGSAEQRIRLTVKRALFRARNRLELDIDLHWPHFNLTLTGVKGLCAWGNNNIGFNVPNGKATPGYQAQGKLSGFDLTVDHLGCGRSGNAYAFGASAKIVMDEEISGETGAPVVNAYSIYKNPLLTGMVYVPPAAPPATTSGSSTLAPAYQSSTGNYTNALGGGLGEALGQLGFSPGDTLQPENPYDDSKEEPLFTGNVVKQIRDIIGIVYKLKPFISSEQVSDKEWQVLDRFKNALDDNTIQQSQLANGKALVNFVLNKVVDGLAKKLSQPIQNLSNQAIGKVRTAVNELAVSPINDRIASTLASVFDRLRQKVIVQVDEQYHDEVASAFTTVSLSISSAIRNSVYSSFEKNVTAKLTGVIELGVTAKVTGFIRKEVTTAGNQLITQGVQANISLGNLVQNGAGVLAGIADTVRRVIVSTNSVTILNTAESLVDDAIAGIDWTAISAQILNELIAKGISAALAGQLTQNIAQSAGPYASAILNTVKFDFSNLGEKLQNGQFDKIVKFDPTTIYVESPAADFRGQLKFTKGDPVFGDSWQGSIFVRVKVPKKDNPIECEANFVNGKTGASAGNFTYWFVRLQVAGLNIPLNPAPIIWDGAEGYVFSKMKKTGTTTVLPDASNKFGIGCRFRFYDQQSSGASYIFDVGAEAVFNTAGFSIQLLGNASALNFQKTGGKYQSPGFITGTGNIGYFKTPEVTKVAGNFNVQFNTQPVLCAGGDAGLDLKTPNDWKVWVGTQQAPLSAKILCKDYLVHYAFLECGNTGGRVGLGMSVNVSAQSPWVEVNSVKVRGFASLQFGYNAFAAVEWEPSFKISEASINAALSAAIGIDYETSATSGSITLAGVNLAGTLSYKSQPQSEIHGSLAGGVTVIGNNINFSLPVHYSLSEQKILD